MRDPRSAAGPLPGAPAKGHPADALPALPDAQPGRARSEGLRLAGRRRRTSRFDLAFAEKWSEVIQEWSDRYGDKVAGWWFDGGYQHISFNEAIADRYAAAVKHGNPKAIVTFNPGVKVIRWTEGGGLHRGRTQRTAVESFLPDRWLEGSQWHALTYLGDNWGRRNTRFTDAQWIEWARKVAAQTGRDHAGHGTQLRRRRRADRKPGRSPGETGQGHQHGPAPSDRRGHPQTAQARRQLLRHPLRFPCRAGLHGDRQEHDAGDDREDHRRRASRLHPDRLQRSSRPVELSDQSRQPGAGICRRSVARLARGDGAARRGALHALLGRLGFRSHPPASGLGGGQRRRQDQRQRDLVLRPLRGPVC